MAEVSLKTSSLSKLSEESIKLLAAEMVLSELSEGDVLIAENAHQSEAFLVSSGSVARFKEHPETQSPLEMNRIEAGAVSGFFHIFKNDPAYYTLRVVSEKASVWKITAESFKKLLTTNDSFFSSWLNYVHGEVRAQSKVIRSFSPNSQQGSKIRVAFFDSTAWTYAAFDKEVFQKEFDFQFFKQRLDEDTARLASGCQVICAFVNDNLGEGVLRVLNSLGVEMIAMRCAGFDRVAVEHAKVYKMTIARVPAYSPYAVAEHAIALLLSLNRRIHRAYQRTRDANFDLRGLIGFDLYGKTAGVVGTGKSDLFDTSLYV
jgi:hypothetical protein